MAAISSHCLKTDGPYIREQNKVGNYLQNKVISRNWSGLTGVTENQSMEKQIRKWGQKSLTWAVKLVWMVLSRFSGCLEDGH